MQQDSEFVKGKVYRFGDITAHVPNTSTAKSILKKTTGILNSLTMDTHQVVDTAFSPFDTYIHVIDGRVEVASLGTSIFLNAGEFVIMPGHARNTSRALQPSKLLQLTIKSGYEDLL
jgi:quercetin dioxygenase-like cupin family protein